MNLENNIPTYGLILTLIGLIVTAFSVNRNLRNRDDDRLAALIKTFTEKFEAQEKLFRAELSAAITLESRARHDLGALCEKQDARLELDLRTLDRAAMRRDEFEKVEKRIEGRFDKIEAKLDAALDRLPLKAA